MSRPAAPPVHGYGAYTRGCRCDVCREAKRARQAEIRARGVTDQLTHGSKSTYDAGCRCDACRAGKQASDRDYYERNRIAISVRNRQRYLQRKALAS